jgi:predicted nucleotidyltransferase
VLAAVRRWAAEEAPRHPGLLRLGLFGSYARGDAGVGSDIDLVAIVSDSPERFDRRAVVWRTELLPLPAELLVYTAEEWERLRREGGRFASTIERESVWL